MLKLKLQGFGHLIQRVNSLEKTLMLRRIGAGGEVDDRGWDGWMASPTRWTWVWINSGSWWWTGRPGVLQFMGWQRVGHDWVTELNWTDSVSILLGALEFNSDMNQLEVVGCPTILPSLPTPAAGRVPEPPTLLTKWIQPSVLMTPWGLNNLLELLAELSKELY